MIYPACSPLLRKLLASLLLPTVVWAAESRQPGNLAHNRTALHSDAIDDDHTAHLATDGFTATYWESRATSKSWIAVDLGAQRQIDQLLLLWGDVLAKQYRVQFSSDGPHPRNWQDIATSAEISDRQETVRFPLVTARHVRLLLSEPSDPGRGFVLREIEVRGEPPAAPPARSNFTARADGSLELTGGNWRLQNAAFAGAAPDQIIRVDFYDRAWLPAVVPGTVLGSYLAQGAVPDPWFGDQMSQISEAFFSRNDFWYRCDFVIPESNRGKQLWLEFDGINWKAEVYLNGTPLGQINGAFIRGQFDVTAVARPGDTNVLAVLIKQVAHAIPGPEKVRHKKIGTPTTNGDLLGYDSPTFVSSAGWNWLPIIRGRNIGIWNGVRLRSSGAVKVIDPWVVSKLSLPATNQAELVVHAELANHSSEPQYGNLVGQIGDIRFSRPLTLAANQTTNLILDSTLVPELLLAQPQLWWPNGYGAQPLYQLELAFAQDGGVSDRKSVNFGVRELTSVITNGVLTFYVNGVRILCRGGNWGMDEGMLNCDAAGYDLRVRLHRDAGLNMIRNWVGMVGRREFYDACDRYGILIFDDFWLANPVDGPDPLDEAMFLANARDKIRRVRSHPSLALYCGRNEGCPPETLDAGLRSALTELDPTRRYLSHSAEVDFKPASNRAWKISVPTSVPDARQNPVTGHGPYVVMDVEWYFAHRGKTFHTEQGIVAVPPVESMRAMLPEEFHWPINDMWAVHDYQSDNEKARGPQYTKRIAARYGEPRSLEDYCRKAQLVNLETAKAMYECLQAHQTGGMLVWMTQPAWPSMICQLYDYYFEPTAAYFGAKKGCAPVHILWDAHTDEIKVANNTANPIANVVAEAQIFDRAGKLKWTHSGRLDLPATAARTGFALPRPTDSVFFVKLALRHGEKILSDNFYWGGPKGGSCVELEQLPPVSLAAAATETRHADQRRIKVQLRNETDHVALAIRLKVVRAASADRVLPVFYEDNYFSLLPGESREVVLEFAAASLRGESPRLLLEGWNIVPQEVTLR